MSHEIQEFDRPVFAQKPAWHKLGLVVDEAPTPRDALTLAGLDWGVEQQPLFYRTLNASGETVEVAVESHVMNTRVDNAHELGVVTSGYRPVQNADMADFCEALAEDKTVKCESVGSIRNGRRVWFLLRGEEFTIGGPDDRIFPYILVSNGHDGGASFRVTPTTIRVVCSNTLHSVIPQNDAGELATAAVCFRHSRNIMDRVAQAKLALQNYHVATQETREVLTGLADQQVNQAAVKQFFLECYTTEYNEIPANPKDKKEERRRNKAMSAFNSFSKRFDEEQAVSGANLWTAFNAFSGLVQHDQKAHGKDDAARVAKRMERNLFGLGQERTLNALRAAMTFQATC